MAFFVPPKSRQPQFLWLAFLCVGISSGAKCLAQATQINQSSGSKNYFSYQVQSTFGTTTSVNANANVSAQAEAQLNLKPNSFVTNKFGDDSGNASAVFTATPSGANVNLSGVSAHNMLIIDKGTYFKSSSKTIDNPNPNLPSIGSASALGNHTSTITVENGSTSFSNTLQQSF